MVFSMNEQFVLLTLKCECFSPPIGICLQTTSSHCHRGHLAVFKRPLAVFTPSLDYAKTCFHISIIDGPYPGISALLTTSWRLYWGSTFDVKSFIYKMKTIWMDRYLEYHFSITKSMRPTPTPQDPEYISATTFSLTYLGSPRFLHDLMGSNSTQGLMRFQPIRAQRAAPRTTSAGIQSYWNNTISRSKTSSADTLFRLITL